MIELTTVLAAHLGRDEGLGARVLGHAKRDSTSKAEVCSASGTGRERGQSSSCGQ